MLTSTSFPSVEFTLGIYSCKKYDKSMLTIRRRADIMETLVKNDEKMNTGEMFSDETVFLDATDNGSGSRRSISA